MHTEGVAVTFRILIQLFTVLVKQSFHFSYHFLFQFIKWCFPLSFCHSYVYICKLFLCNTKFDSKDDTASFQKSLGGGGGGGVGQRDPGKEVVDNESQSQRTQAIQ